MKWVILSLSYLIILLIVLINGPLIGFTSAAPSSSVKVSLNWVNECVITGNVVDTIGSSSKTTSVTLTDTGSGQGCIQNWKQNGKNTIVQYFDNNTCQQSDIWASPYEPGTPIVQGQIYYLAPGVNGGCIEDSFTSSHSLSIGNDSNANIVFVLNGNTITRVDGDSYYTFTQSSSDKSIYIDNNEAGPGNCNDEIIVNSNSSGTLWELTLPSSNPNSDNPSNIKPPPSIQAPGCYVSYYDDDINGPEPANNNGTVNPGSYQSGLGPIPIITTGGACSTNNPNSAAYCSDHPQNSNGSFTLHLGGSTNVPPGSQTGNGNVSPSTAPAGVCQPGGINLSWIICPVINAVVYAENDIENVIGGLLQTAPIEFDNNNCNSTIGNCIFKAWSNIRLYGDLLLVVALLIAILVEAFGGGVAEAYTVKRMLPRILVAAILINLSIYFIAAAEDITNTIGHGIYGIIREAFGSANWNFTPNGFSADVLPIGLLTTGYILFSGEALAFFSLFVLLPALFALISVLFTILIRQVLLLLLLILSPLAFALYCLPNTEQYFKKWWDLLFKTLMVYPIMMVIFASGYVAYIITNWLVNGNNPHHLTIVGTASDAAKFIPGMLPIMALVAPLFLMPFAFKMAGGVIGNIHAALNSVGKKATEAIKGNPNDPMSLRNRTRRNFTMRQNARGLSWAQVGARVDPRQVTQRGRDRSRAIRRLRTQTGQDMLRRQLESSDLWKTVSQDSNILREIANYNSEDQARNALEADFASGVIDQRQYDQRSAAIAGAAAAGGWNPVTRRAALMNPNYIKFEVARGQQGWNRSTAIMRDIAGGDPFQYRSLMDEYQAVAKGPAGRADQAGNVDGNPGYDLDRATASQSTYMLLNGHQNGVAGLIDEHLSRLNNTAAYLGPGATPDQIAQARRQSAIFLNEMRNASTKNQGTAGARDVINERLGRVNQAYNDYVNEATTQSLAISTPIARREAVEITEPGTTPGSSVTRRQVAYTPLTGAGQAQQQSREDEARRRVIQDLDTASRAYTPPDPNNIES